MLKDDFKVIQIVFQPKNGLMLNILNFDTKKYTKIETIKNVLVEIKLKSNL